MGQMNPPASQILTAAQMRRAEDAIIEGGTSVENLMHTAGTRAGEWCRRIAGGRSATILCGPGNNGGDGYVIAEYLRKAGLDVAVVAPLAPTTDAAKSARAKYAAEQTEGAGRSGGILIDCLFGSGLTRALSTELMTLLQGLANTHPYRVAIDLPSGVEADTGARLNDGLPEYDLTLALGAWKWAHWTMPASAMMGLRRLVPIGVESVEGSGSLIAKPELAVPAMDSHKYSRGYLGILGGTMPGAAVLSATAAMRSGAGYVKLLSDSSHPGVPPDLVVDDRDWALALGDDRFDALLVGPGLGRELGVTEKLNTVLGRNCPMVLDADALIQLAPEMLEPVSVPIIATPHTGEMAALCKVFEVRDGLKREMALKLAEVSGMIIIAKGPDSFVAAPDGRIAVAPPATSWLSVAGSGDVLAGIVASRLATGAPPFRAACEGLWLHAEAARLCGAPFTANELAHSVRQAYAAAL